VEELFLGVLTGFGIQKHRPNTLFCLFVCYFSVSVVSRRVFVP
jgi:hypothetical protein